MNLRRLRWAVVMAVVVFLGVFEYTRHVLEPVLLSWPGTLLLYGVVLLCILFFSVAVFKALEEMQGQLERRNRELLALHEAGLDISAELSLDLLLQKVVDTARELVDARYGALAVYRADSSIQAFITSGVDPEAHAAIGAPPEGKGLLGLVLAEGERLRLADLRRHPASGGFPPHHPPMRSLLAVPVVCRGPCRGNLYVAEKEGPPEFSAEDEETLVRFATQSAIAIDNAYLHHQVSDLAAAEERLRIAHEMHDGLAQVLAYVNTKAQAVREFLRNGRLDGAAEQLDQLAGAARDVYGDVREAILGLRASSKPSRKLVETLRDYVENWQDRTGIRADLAVPGELEVPPGIEVHLLRVVQEALGNVRKHAQAEHAAVRIERAGGEVVVTVSDDGVGFDPEAPRRGEFPRFGLTTMRERAESAGGTMRLESRPGGGTQVVVRFPVRVQATKPMPLEEIAHARPDR
jgi:signal transduction histidine kinase